MQAAAAHQLVYLTPLLTATTPKPELICCVAASNPESGQLLYNAPLHQLC